MNLYNKIYEAVNTGIQKALIITNDQSEDTSINFHHKKISSEFALYGYRTVNMGTGILWCEYNLGAFPGNKVSDWCGDCYAWGEIETKNEYTRKNYKYHDNTETLLPENDVVSVTLGTQFRMPTVQEYSELLNNTIHKWVKDYEGIQGLNGMLFVSKINGNILFFPATGYYGTFQYYNTGQIGYFWSSSIKSDYTCDAYYLCFNAKTAYIQNGNRHDGQYIRGVQDLPLN